MKTGVSLHDMRFDFMMAPDLVRHPERMTVRDLMESFRYERAKQDLSEGVPDALDEVSFDEFGGDASSIFDIDNSLALNPETTTHPLIQAYLWHHAARLGLVEVFNDTFPLFKSRFYRMWEELATILEDDEPEDEWGDLEGGEEEIGVKPGEVCLTLSQMTQVEQWALGNLWPFQLSEEGDEGSVDSHSDAAGFDFTITHNFINFESYDRHQELRFDSLRLIFEVDDDETGVDITVQYQNVSKIASDKEVFARLLADWTGRMADRLCQILTLSSFCVAEGVELWTQDLNSLDFVFPYSHQPDVSFPYSRIQWDQIEELVRSWATDTEVSDEGKVLAAPERPFDIKSFLHLRSARIEQDRRERIQEITVLIQKRKWIGAARMWARRVEGTRANPPVYEVESYLKVADAWMEAGVWYEAASLLRVLNNNWLTEEGSTEEWEQLRLRVLAEREDVFKVWEQFLQEYQSTPIPHVWERLAASTPELPPPSVREGEDGWILDWSNPGVGLEVEIDGSTLQWGGHDHAYNRSGWGESPVDNLTEELLLWLDRVTHHNRARGDEHTF